MKNEKSDIPSKCWNKFRELHKDKIVYLNKLYDILNNLSKILCEFEMKYKSLGIDAFINPIENNKINETIKLINKSIISFTNLNGTMLKNILKRFKDFDKLIKNERTNYDEFLLYSMQYDEEKQKMNQSKKLFIEKMGLIEDFIKSEIIEKKSNKLEKKDMENAINEFNIFMKYAKEANNKRINFNKSQKQLLNLYQKIIAEKEVEFYQKINMNFYTVQKSENDTSSNYVDKMKNKKKVNKNEYINEVISLYSSKDKPEEAIETCFYNLKYKPYPTNKDSTSEDIIKTSQISEEIVKKLRKYINEYFPNCILQIQEALPEIPDILNKYLEIEIELTDDNKNEIIKLIKEDITIYPQFLTILNKLRSNSKLYKSNPYIEFLGYILKEILLIAEQRKDYNAAKNCILLSQTYFIKDEKTDKKVYIFDKIRNNKWVNSAEFWRVFINNQIKKEFKRFESSYPDQNLNLINNNTNLPKKYEGRVKEILFCCLLAHINNMNEFSIDKRIIIKILDEFINKYQYLDGNGIKDLYEIISKDQEEIEKLRKEYQENTNLENEIINNQDKKE